MFKYRRTNFTLLFAVVLTAVIHLTLAQAAYSQSNDIQDVPGMMLNKEAVETEDDMKDAESFDADSIEKEPVAADDRADRVSAASADSSTTAFYPIPVPLPGGLDHVANGVGTRNAGYGTIRLRGVPPGAQAVRAFLYWGTIKAAATPTETIAFRGVPVTGRLIGVSQTTCWGSGVFTAYRASVIALIGGGINGDYLVSKMPSSITDGRDPWSGAAPLPLSEGASLVVLYAHRSIPRTAQTFINNGAAFFYSAININNPLPVPLQPYTQMKHTRLGGDGQVGFSTRSIRPITDERTFIGPPFFTQIKGPFSPFNGDSDWNGDDGAPLNQLWDTHTDSFGRILAPGIWNYVVRYTANGDCVFAVAHILSTR
jgi:hypothetical protein